MKISVAISIFLLLCLAAPAFSQEIAREAFANGQKAFSEQRYEDALQLFLKARETDPNNAEVHIWLGNAYLVLGRADEAAAAWQKALDLAPDNATLKARLERLRGVIAGTGKDIGVIEALLEQRMYKGALAKCQEMLAGAAAAEKRALVELLVCEALWGTGDNQRALEGVLAWLAAYPEAAEQARARLVQGRALAGLGKNAEARNQFLYVIEKYGDSPFAREANFEMGRLLEKEGDEKASLAYYQKVFADGKETEKWYVREAMDRALTLLLALAEREGIPMQAASLAPSLEKALELIVRAAKLNDDSALAAPFRVLEVIARRYIEIGSPAVAATTVKKFIDALNKASKYQAPATLLLGDAYFAEGAKIFEENLSRFGVAAESEKLNSGFVDALKTYLGAAGGAANVSDAAIKKAIGVATFYEQKALMKPAIAAYEEIARVPLAGLSEIKLRLARAYFSLEKNEAAKLAATFQAVPNKLGDNAKKSLAIIKEVATAEGRSQTGLNALRLAQEIAGFYSDLLYYGVAREAIYLLIDKPPAAGEKPVGALADFATLAAADVARREADRDYSMLAATYDAIKTLQHPTEQHKRVLAAYQNVAAWYPESALAATARWNMISIGDLYQKAGAYEAAREIYLQIAGANKDWAGAERARFAAAQSLVRKADEAFAKWAAEAAPGEKPAKLSAEYDVAIKDLVAAIKEKPSGAYVQDAYRAIRGVAIRYCRADAWDIASAVYETLLDKDLAYRYPEQVQFERALCEIGKVMPEHALEMLELIAREPVPVKLDGFSMNSWGYLPAEEYGRDKNELAALHSELAKLADERDALREHIDTLEKIQDDYSEIRAAKEAEIQSKAGESAAPPANDSRLNETYVKMREKEAEIARNLARVEYQTQQQQQQQLRQQGEMPDQGGVSGEKGNLMLNGDRIVRIPILTEEEIARRVAALKAANAILQKIINENAGKAAAVKARLEILNAVQYLRSIYAYNHAAEILAQFLKDNPKDGELAALSLMLRMDYLAWAHVAPDPKMDEVDRLKETGARFEAARKQLEDFIKTFADERELVETARLQLAASYLDEARLVAALSPAQSRGRYVRAATELLSLGSVEKSPLRTENVFGWVRQIAAELERNRFWQDAIEVYQMLTRQYPVESRANQIGLMIANDYERGLNDYLRAMEAYQEFLNSDQGANAGDIQQRILNMAAFLKGEKRWVEALHIYNVFVDSFPRHPRADESLWAIGEIHQANQAWEKAISAYERVIEEYKKGEWTRRARLSIATCYIQLSQWQKAIRTYEDYLSDYPNDREATFVSGRIPTLKDIERFQQLIDAATSTKIDDAQNEMARIIETRLSDRVKAIVEYEKVAAKFPKSHLADDALFAAGRLYLAEGELDKGRVVLMRVAVEYPTSPVADDALYVLGQSYEKEADQIAGITREAAEKQARGLAQKQAYQEAQQSMDEAREGYKKDIGRLRAEGKTGEAELAEAGFGAAMNQAGQAAAGAAAEKAGQAEMAMTAYELANRQDRINAALREAIAAFQKASDVVLGDFADDALLRMAEIYETRLKDPVKAMAVYDKIVTMFPGTAASEDAMWRRALYYEREGNYKKAAEEYNGFLRNYSQSKRAEEATFRLAEMYEQQKMWIEAMDTYRKYETNYPNGPRVEKAKERRIWINTYQNLSPQ